MSFPLATVRHPAHCAPGTRLLGVVILLAGAAAGRAHADLGPSALAVSKDGKTLYVALADARQVAWVDLSSGKVLRRADVPAEPSGLALSPDGSKLAVTCAAPKSAVVLLDPASGAALASIPVGHTATGPAITPDGKRLYVCNRFDDDVSVIDLAAGRETARVRAVREPIAAAATPDGRSVLVANHLPATRADSAFEGDVSAVITVIDVATGRTSAIPLAHGANSLRGLCVTPDGRHALTTHLLSNFRMVPFRIEMGWINTNVLSVVDLSQQKVQSTIGLDEFEMGAGNPWGIACSPDGKTVCVALSGKHQLCLIDTPDLLGDFARRTMQPMMGVWPIYPSLGTSLWRRVKLPGKGPRGLAAAGSKVYAAEYFTDSVAAVDRQAAEDVPAGSIALGPAPRWDLVRRGEFLFHDATICHQHWQSCASCHPDARADGLNWDLMNDGVGNPKNTKSMLLSHETPPAMAEGVRMSAEEAVRSGITHILFAQRPEEEAAAIDAYLKSLRAAPSPRLVDGRLSPAAERGKRLFESERVGCAKCHPAPQYTDLKSHNIGSRTPNEPSDRFDTPTLVEVWRTAPYLHDGRYPTLKDLLVEGQHGLRGRPRLSGAEMDDLVEFVGSL